jgi:DNA-binding NarL/FixJ family response regulator
MPLDAEARTGAARSSRMSSASTRPAPPVAAPPVSAAVIGGDEPARHRIARLLAEAGFAALDLRESDAQAAPAAAVLLLGRMTDARRVREIRAATEAHPGTRVLAVMPAGATNASLRRVLLAGAAAIVLDDDLERTLAPTARAMVAGQLTVPAALVRQIAPRPLSHREKQILALVAHGRTNREIADRLVVAESTVKTHLVSAFRKLDVRSRAEAVARITDPETGYGAGVLALAEPAEQLSTT